MIGLEDVQAAASRIKGQIVRTPFLRSAVLSHLTGAEIFVKFENHQFTASFKERGALNKLLGLGAEAHRAGVCAMSAGNHAQGVAYHAARLGIPVTIVMPRTTPATKVEATRAHGATIVLDGDTLADAQAIAARLTAERSLIFVHPYDDAEIMAGQGTAALEMLDDVPDLDALVAPIGGGGLIAGLAVAAKARRPAICVVGVQAAGYPAMRQTLRGEEATGSGATIAEGIAVQNPGALTRAIVREHVDDVLLVSEDNLEHAVALFLNIEKTVAEGAGAAGLACVLAHPERFRGQRVGLLLSGGNIDPRLLASIIMRELVRERRMTTVRIPIADRPGLLARITAILGEADANVLDVSHHRNSLALPAKEAILNVTFETRDGTHTDAVIGALQSGGFHPLVVVS